MLIVVSQNFIKKEKRVCPREFIDEEMQISLEAKQTAGAVQGVPVEEGQVFRLSIIQKFSHQEISDATEVLGETVKTRAQRGFLWIRAFLGLDNSKKNKEISV